MSGFSESDSAHMARALELAARGEYAAHPNPMVGCVLVRDGRVIGEGWHQCAGEAHAEVNAIAAAGDASGATAYVSLEPCSHDGKTGPCTTALIEADVAELVVAMPDPFAAAGRGTRLLEDAGIRVRTGLMEEEAALLNQGFLKRVSSGRPYVRLKVAASLDGATAMKSGESQWITGPEARADVQKLRAKSGAVMTGIGTVLADDPSLNVRDEGIDTRGRQPLRVILDSTLRMPASAQMLHLPGETLVYCTDESGRRSSLENEGAEVILIGAGDARVDIAAVLDDLGRREVNDLLVEAGPGLSGTLLDAGLVDELVIYQAPHIMGSETRPMFETPAWVSLADRRSLRISDVCRVGEDTRISAAVIKREES
jgi:diaminohydroxyphosphoribosylaminopyrimidine deaminase/5-amino-6-(5-phosphoribosylamino)uracil reductase